MILKGFQYERIFMLLFFSTNILLISNIKEIMDRITY